MFPFASRSIFRKHNFSNNEIRKKKYIPQVIKNLFFCPNVGYIPFVQIIAENDLYLYYEYMHSNRLRVEYGQV